MAHSADPEPRFFLDSADLRQWETWLPVGLFFGVTTNPVLLRDSGQSCSCDNLEMLVRRAVDLNVREVQIQTWGMSVDAMVRTGRLLADMDPRVVVKVPATRNGTVASARLLAHGVRITMTCVFEVHQALTAAALGADYVAPYLGRMTDQGQDGIQAVAEMQTSVSKLGSSLRVLVASIREVKDITVLAGYGVNTFTLSAVIASQWFGVDATNQAAEVFEQAARASPMSEKYS
jgi:transaldolase